MTRDNPSDHGQQDTSPMLAMMKEIKADILNQVKASEEAMKAEESLQQQRWKEIIKDWYGEIKQSGVRGLRSVEDFFKHIVRQGKSYQSLGIKSFDFLI